MKAVIHATLHSISGLIIVFLPLLYVYKKTVNYGFLTMSLGGITIGIGGLALASIIAGKPILPMELVVQLLHPLLFISGFLLSLGIYFQIKD